MEQILKNLPASIGPYSILKSLGRGGMGEVFLAKDFSCHRNIALKRIRPDLKMNKALQQRFLREAEVASTLAHPSIIPILSIEKNVEDTYYTMPFVDGETLRQVLRKTQEKIAEPSHPIGRSIPSLTRIFLQVCEAVAYTHSKGILHRDLKPENILIGKYGEVMIFDWGIADFLDHIQKPASEHSSFPLQNREDLTRPGKITGTLAYMPPECLTGLFPPSVQIDIYALGVILYQLLTLQLPFQRKRTLSFYKKPNNEELIDPMEMAPYRDIPRQLASICKKCLHPKLSERYESTEDLIAEIKNYIEGRPEWIYLGSLDLKKKEHWKFQENILLAKHIAITKSLDVTDWAALAISQRPFAENLMMETEIALSEGSRGVGFLLSIPEAETRKSLEEGYCLWIHLTSCRLFRNNVQVMEAQNFSIKPDTWHKIRIEKIEDSLKVSIDEFLILNFLSRLPLRGSHAGFLHKDEKFFLRQWFFYDGSHNLTVNCLAVPNSFLSHKLYDLALKEYRRIGQSFPGRLEGREALFRAGLTLLEKGKALKDETVFHLALKEFEELYRTSGAPLEYLGKALVYEALAESEEESKCLELALRKFPKHFLLPLLKEHIVYRMHNSSLNHREAAYRIILLALRHISNLLANPDTQALLESLEKNWESIPFIEPTENTPISLAIQLAFWLAKPPILAEIATEILKIEPVDEPLLANAVFALLEIEEEKPHLALPFLKLPFPRIAAIRASLEPIGKTPIPPRLSLWESRCLKRQIRNELSSHKTEGLTQIFSQLKKCKFAKSERLEFEALEAWHALLTKKYTEAKNLFEKYVPTALSQETSPLYFPYGTYLYLTEGSDKALAHFSFALDSPYPPTTALPAYFLKGWIDEKKGWIERAFSWEKKELYRQLDLFHFCTNSKTLLTC